MAAKSPTLFTLSLFMLICSCSWSRTNGQSVPPDSASGSSSCLLEYIEQPPAQLQCNPYLNAELRLECTVEAQEQLNQMPRVVWYRSRYAQVSRQTSREQSQSQSRSKRNAGGLRITELLDNTLPGVLIREQSRTLSTGFSSVRSRLQLTNLDATDSGEYWCTIELNGQGETAVSSDTLLLKEPAFFSAITTACSTTRALSMSQRKCAIVSRASSSTNSAEITTQGHAATTMGPTSSTPAEKSTPPAAVTSGGKLPTSSSSPNTIENVDNNGAGATTQGGMSNPIDDQGTATSTTTTEEPTQTGNSSGTGGDSVASGDDNSGRGNATEAADSNTNPNVLLELYIAIAILVIFGVIILILIPVTIWMCLKKRKSRKIEGMRRARQNLELASARCDVQTISSQTNIASDYLVPQPSWRSHRKQVEPVDCQSTDCLHRSYETTLSYSHEYEDIVDVVTADGSTNHHEVYCTLSASSPTTSGVLEEPVAGPPTDANLNNDPVKMKRNAAYRLYSTEQSNVRRHHAYCNDVVVPHPLDCLHTQTEQSSNLE